MLTPPDYLQGETVRIMYVHVPVGLAGNGGLGGDCGCFDRAARLAASACGGRRAGRSRLPGATFALICLLTGSIWGRPTWGTWWEWDGRLTSMLILFFLYLGYIALAGAERERGGEGRIAALFGLVGAINLPIIHYSVLWWRTLHQGQSIGIRAPASTVRSCGRFRWPRSASPACSAPAVLMRMRAELAEAKVEARMRRAAAE